MMTWLKRLGVALGVFVLVAGAFAAFCAHAYRDELHIDAATGIDEEGYVKIGGIDQWIQIRGRDRRNPVLLWLSGGPGFSTIPNTYALRDWEKHFTVVMWDQRGEGKTFDRSGTSVAPTMTIGRMAKDGIEVTQYLQQRLHTGKIILLGHSWGSILGVHMAHMRPDLFAAYVGTGQVTHLEKQAQAAYPLLVERARSLGNKTAEEQLVAAGPPPYPEQGLKKWTWVYWANQLDAKDPPRQRFSFGALWWLAGVVLRQGNQGADFSQNLMWTSIMKEDLPSLGLHFDVPVVFIQGAEDRLTVTALAKDYFDRIDAPSKRFVLIPGEGHLAIVFGHHEFLRALENVVRPIALESGGR